MLVNRLAELGVRRVWGQSLGDLENVAVGDPDLAVLLADADGRIGEVNGGSRLGAALIAGPILHLSSKPGGASPMQVAGSAEDLLDILASPAGLAIPDTNAIHLDLDLNAPVPEGLTASAGAQRQPVMTLDPSMSSLRIMALVGPGVIRSGSLDGLRSFSRVSGAGIFNTWGAKGVERWDSPWHFGTVGPQVNDLALAGFDSVDVLITSGLDPAELPGGLAHAVIQDVPPAQLGALCHGWETAATEPVRPPLYDAVSAAVGPMYEDESMPLSPARAALHLSGALPVGAMAVGDPGPSGFWLARTFPTSIPNSVCVPASGDGGFAAAAALVCAVEGRAVLAVADRDSPASDITEDLVSLATSLGVPIALQLWSNDPSGAISCAEHVDLCLHQLSGAAGVAPVGVNLELPDSLVDACGPVSPVFSP